MDLRKRPLVAGAFALFMAGIANRLIGTVYRVLLVRFAGEEAVGLFQMTMPVYRIVATIASAGIPVAIARLAADALGQRDFPGARRYFRTGVSLTTATSVAAALFLLLTHRFWAYTVMTDSRTSIALAILPLLLVPAAFSASLRGVLQGQERLGPVAFSSFAEATSRVPVVLLLVHLLIPYGAGWAAGGIAAGLVAGEIVSVYYLARAVRGSWEGSRPIKPPGSPGRVFVPFWSPRELPVVLRLAQVATPVLLSGLINGLLGMFNVAIIPRELIEAGYAPREATALYGRLFGMALPTLYMPMVAVHPLVHAAIPAVAKRLAEGKSRSVLRLLVQCFSVAIAVAAVAAIGFWQYGENVGRLLYGVSDLGSLIAPLAFAAPFVYIGHIAAGILYGLGRTGVAMLNTIAGSGLRLLLIYLLVADPQWGIIGALWAVIADYALTALLDLAAVAVLVPREMRRRKK